MTSRPFMRLASVFGLALALGACTLGGNGDGGSDDDGRDGDGHSGGEDVADAEGAPFFLPTGEPANTSAPSIEVDATGRIHAVYPAYVGGGAYYATCAADCAGPQDVDVVLFPTDGTVANAMLALDDEGRPRVLLDTFSSIDFATCDADCGDEASWAQSTILEHAGKRQVTGEALALDPAGNPRFLMHTYVAYLGIGQEAPETLFVTCDGACTEPSSWSQHPISNQIWQSSSLRFDAEGRAHAGTVAHVVGDDASTQLVGAYLQCASDCGSEDAWHGVPLESAFKNDMDAIAVAPAVSLALTSGGAPRLAILGQDEAYQRRIVYFGCDEGCTDGAAWSGLVLSDAPEIGPGLDLALDADGKPRLAYTFDYSIGLAFCDADDCADADWDLAKVELSGEMDPDDIFLEENCTVAAWFLHSPSVALSPSGRPRVGYQARDISGGWDNPDEDKADCEAGTDMTWSRLALLGELE